MLGCVKWCELSDDINEDASDLLRELQNKLSFDSKSRLAYEAAAVELCCRQKHIIYDRNTFVSYAGISHASYLKFLNTSEQILGLSDSSEILINNFILCCGKQSNNSNNNFDNNDEGMVVMKSSKILLNHYKEYVGKKSKGSTVDIKSAVYLAAAFIVIAKKHQIKIDKKRVLNYAKIKEKDVKEHISALSNHYDLKHDTFAFGNNNDNNNSNNSNDSNKSLKRNLSSLTTSTLNINNVGKRSSQLLKNLDSASSHISSQGSSVLQCNKKQIEQVDLKNEDIDQIYHRLKVAVMNVHDNNTSIDYL